MKGLKGAYRFHGFAIVSVWKNGLFSGRCVSLWILINDCNKIWLNSCDVIVYIIGEAFTIGHKVWNTLYKGMKNFLYDAIKQINFVVCCKHTNNVSDRLMNYAKENLEIKYIFVDTYWNSSLICYYESCVIKRPLSLLILPNYYHNFNLEKM